MSESGSDKPKGEQPQERSSRSKSRGSSSRRREVRVTSPEESMLQKHELASHHRRDRKKRDARGIGELNLTSMIDVIFLLLIYFVITANFVKDEGVLVAKLPSGTGTEEQEKLPDLPINIRVASRGETEAVIEVNGKGLGSFGDLAAYLMQNQDNPVKGRTGIYAPDNPIIIHPTAKVQWAHVVNAFNAAVRADYTSVSFAQASPG